MLYCCRAFANSRLGKHMFRGRENQIESEIFFDSFQAPQRPRPHVSGCFCVRIQKSRRPRLAYLNRIRPFTRIRWYLDTP